MAKSPVFLVGAGASFVAPALLPMFDQLRSSLAGWMKLPVDPGDASVPASPPPVELASERSPRSPTGLSIAEKIKIMPPEVFMQCVRLGGAPLNAWLAETLGTGEPNAVHAVLAWALDHDAPVWSLNVDELIESVPATADEDPSVAAGVGRRRLVPLWPGVRPTCFVGQP